MTDMTIEARKARLFDRTSDAALIGGLRILAAKTNPTGDDRIVHAWTIDEIERRFPAAADAVTAAFEAADNHEEATGEYVHVDYAAVLLANIPA